MKKRVFGLLTFLLAPGASVLGQAAGGASDLAGDWACYGYEESDAGMYSGDYDIAHTADGTWRSEGRFGSVDEATGGMPFEWDFSATGTWKVAGDSLVYATRSIRFLPTRGGADYEAADPRDYLRIPVSGSWHMEVEEPIFMTLESDDGLLFECDKQVFD